ncbi:hypothetical protein Scep_015089 [Stephania cephalantha]|uniref:Uncharacterized protein n=1 Tax=Stephania cephalantha TaxID=152367 RepID=A0AAP0J4H0_9MAGN
MVSKPSKYSLVMWKCNAMQERTSYNFLEELYLQDKSNNLVHITYLQFLEDFEAA